METGDMLVWEQACPACKGTGIEYRRPRTKHEMIKPKEVLCSGCNGWRTLPTPAGERLLAFLARHFTPT